MNPASKYVGYFTLESGLAEIVVVYHMLQTREIIVSCYYQDKVVHLGWTAQVLNEQCVQINLHSREENESPMKIDKIVVIG